ncbi:MAG: DUF2330 domain-containing protein [Candidatus Aenigmarchaeota archaeon]|nr:DUF2330 domain-containing protein [Candidatus Aenigmarchaeota archaeon]
MDNKKSLLILILFISLLILPSVRADGGFFPPTYYNEDLFEPTQKAVILYNNGEERIVLQVSYNGSMKDFAWIVPVPGYPVVNTSDPLLFEELHYLTEPNYIRAPFSFWGFGYFSDSIGAAYTKEQGATLLERYQVGIYDISILSATDPDALINWLNQNNYSISQNARSVIQHYIDKEWYFIAIRIELASYTENILETLKKIDSRITNQENAVQYLTEDLVNYVKEEKLYSELSVIRETEIEYGEETLAKIRENPYYYQYYMRYGSVPTRLIDENRYTQLYEAYNGYLDKHMTETIKREISLKLNQKIEVPYYYTCYQGQSVSEYCYVWYFTKASDEYNILKDVNCGSYCSRISSTKEQYSAEDLAYVAANAIMTGNENIKNYFEITETSYNWYDNYNDQFDYVKNMVNTKLVSVLNQKYNALKSQLEQQLAQDYSQQTGMNLVNIDSISSYFAGRTLQDIKDGKSFLASYIYSFSLISSDEYSNFVKWQQGDHDDYDLRTSMEEIVENVVYFEAEQVATQLDSGTIQPLLITFNSPKIVYPLKMSSINKGATEILLYVFADYKTELDGFQIEYAKWLEPEAVRSYSHINDLLDSKYFLTKMRKSMYPDEMEDLTIAQAPNNNEYRLDIYEPSYVANWIMFIFSMVFLGLGVFGLFLFTRWINNKYLIKGNKKSVYYADNKMCLHYAIGFTVMLSLSIIFSAIGGFYGYILSPFGQLFQFLGQLLNFIGIPQIINFLVLFILAILLIFEVIHISATFVRSKLRERSIIKAVASTKKK